MSSHPEKGVPRKDPKPGTRDRSAHRKTIARAVLLGAFVGSNAIEAAVVVYVVYLVVQRRPLPGWAARLEPVARQSLDRAKSLAEGLPFF